MFDNIEQQYQLVNQLVQKINDPELSILSKFLRARIANPESYVVLLGETSSGKSTLINGLLGKPEMYTSVKPSTGAVTEIAFKADGNSSENQYYVINKDATMEIISPRGFKQFMMKPDDRVARLRLITVPPRMRLNNLRLFDTPGYGSVIEKHEEVLEEFIPNSDLIIYVVSYRVGIQADDFNFISHARELMNEETQFVLVINMCPPKLASNDKRINEINRYAEDILHQAIPIFCVPYEVHGDDEYPLPACDILWEYVQNIVASPKHISNLKKVLSNYILGLLDRSEAIINSRILQRDLSETDREFLNNKVREIKTINTTIKREMIEPTFQAIIRQIPDKLNRVKMSVIEAAEGKIDKSSKLDQHLIEVFVNEHLLQFKTKKQMKEVQLFIETTLDDLDRRMNDKLNKEYARLEKEIELHFSFSVDNLAQNILRGPMQRTLENALLGYFKQFAGRGGTGIANAAKHGLKVVGDMFGHTFKRETHNALARTLSKIGATSAKSVTIFVAVVIESLIYCYEISTWQPKLKKAVGKGMDKWYYEMLESLEKDLMALKETNLQLLDDETNSWILEYEKQDDSTIDYDMVAKLEEKLIVTKKRVGELII